MQVYIEQLTPLVYIEQLTPIFENFLLTCISPPNLMLSRNFYVILKIMWNEFKPSYTGHLSSNVQPYNHVHKISHS